MILHKHIGAGVLAALVLGLLLTPPAVRAEDKTPRPADRRPGKTNPGPDQEAQRPQGAAGDAADASRAAEARAARRLGRRPEVALHRPRHHGRPHRRLLRLRGRSLHLLGRHRLRRPAQDHQQRRHLRAPVRPRKHRLRRRRLRGPVRPQHRLGRHRREQPAQLRLLRRRRLQIDRRRQDLEEHGAEEVFPDRPHRHPSQGPEHRLRRRPRPALRTQRGARPVQDDRRRQDVEQGPVHRRQDGDHRRADAPDRPGDAAGRDVGAAARRASTATAASRRCRTATTPTTRP